MKTSVYRLQDVLINYDYLRKPLSSMERENFKGEYPYYGAQGIIDYVQTYRCDGEYLLIAEDGENLMSRSQPLALIANGRFWVNNHAHIVKTNGLADLRYVCYSLNHLDITGYITGSAQPKLSQTNLNKIKMAFPPLEYQIRIVSILSSYDNLIEVNNKRIKMLEQMAENLYREWFVRFRFPGHETAEFENGIPKGWAYRRADQVIDFNPTLKTGNQTEFTIIPMEALSTNSMVLDSSCFVRQDSISGRRSQNGDILLAKITPCLENGKTGFVMGMPENEVLGGSTEFVVMRSKALTPHYVYCIARSYYFRQTAILSMNGADGRQRVDEDKLKSTKILQPGKAMLDRFEAIITPIFDGIYKLVLENKNLIQQRDLLLPRLMSGRLTSTE